MKKNKVEKIMDDYREGVKKIEEAYIVAKQEKMDFSEIDQKIEYEKSFIKTLESESKEQNKDLIERAKARLEVALKEKEEVQKQNEEIDAQNNKTEFKNKKVILPSGREVTQAEKDEIDKNHLKDVAIRELNKESKNISEELAKKDKELKENREKRMNFKYEFEKDENGKSTGKVLNEDELDKIQEEFQNLKKEMIDLNKMQEDCEKYLNEFKQKDQEKMEAFSKAWNNVEKTEKIKKIEKPEKTEEMGKSEKYVKSDSIEYAGKAGKTNIVLNVSKNKVSMNGQELEGKYKLSNGEKINILENLEIDTMFEGKENRMKYIDYSLVSLLEQKSPKLVQNYLNIIKDGSENQQEALKELKEQLDIKYKFEKGVGTLINFRAKKIARMAHRLGIAELEGIKEKSLFEIIISKAKQIKLPAKKEKIEALASGKETKQKQGLEDIVVDNKDNRIEKKAVQLQQDRKEIEAQSVVKDSVNEIINEEMEEK